MFEEYYPSQLLANAVKQFSSLPGIGEKTALRLVLHLLKQDPEQVLEFAQAIVDLKQKSYRCKICHNISDNEVCDICSNPARDHSIVCVVEDIQDLLAIERTRQYNGVYHVLEGLISPIEGIGPADLNISTLENRVEQGQIKEVILALNTTAEGDATALYLYKKLKKFDIKVSTIARGVAFGDELQYTDEITLGRSIIERKPFED
jgi:recombination protein RecR